MKLTSEALSLITTGLLYDRFSYCIHSDLFYVSTFCCNYFLTTASFVILMDIIIIIIQFTLCLNSMLQPNLTSTIISNSQAIQGLSASFYQGYV